MFNAEQCEGLPAQYSAKAEPPALPPAERIERADRFFAATCAEIRHAGARADYAREQGGMNSDIRIDGVSAG